MKVIDLFKEEDTRDELGIGVIRDTLAEHFFPGTTTIQTRAKYFLFLPWIYLELERKNTPSAEMKNRSRRLQDRLCQALIAGGEEKGVIGYLAGFNIQRLPSSVYWQGLLRWGILKFQGAEGNYYRDMDRFYRRQFAVPVFEKGEAPDPQASNWDRDLYRLRPPESWLDKTDFSLSAEEAEFLIDHIQVHHRDSLLVFLINKKNMISDNVRFPWQQPGFENVPTALFSDLRHARVFSKVMHGAALLYNLILAEQIKSEEKCSDYHISLDEWWSSLHIDSYLLDNWSFKEFRDLISRRLQAKVSSLTWAFTERWLLFVRNEKSIASLIAAKEIREMITAREHQLKRSRARIDNPRAKELWNGASGTGQLDYRWNRPVRDIINDLLGPIIKEK